MIKIMQRVTLAVFLVVIIEGVAAAEGFYVGLLGGVGVLSDSKASDSGGNFNISYEPGFDGAVSFGYHLGESHPDVGRGRVELEFNMASNDLQDAEFVDSTVTAAGSAKRQSLMINTIGEYVMRSGMVIYALVGLGGARVELEDTMIVDQPLANDSDSQLAYQFGLGIGWPLSKHFTIDFGYRYFGTTDLTFTKNNGEGLDYEYASHRFLAGIRLGF
jgi:opacity protein-like surface antigen